MIDPSKTCAPETPDPSRADPRPAYEPPRVTRKKAVSRATLFSGQGGTVPEGVPPLVANG